MPMLRTLEEYLEEHEIRYQILTHAPAHTAQEIAHAEHLPGKMVAKVIVVKKENGAPVMVVLPATHKITFAKLRQVLHTRFTLATEEEFRPLFPGCETGAEPPFGNLFGVDTIVDTALTENEEIAFNAGSHWQMIRIRMEDYLRLLHPRIATVAEHV
jgi:Ala-tRNA(Pro) deacylase